MDNWFEVFKDWDDKQVKLISRRRSNIFCVNNDGTNTMSALDYNVADKSEIGNKYNDDNICLYQVLEKKYYDTNKVNDNIVLLCKEIDR